MGIKAYRVILTVQLLKVVCFAHTKVADSVRTERKVVGFAHTHLRDF